MYFSFAEGTSRANHTALARGRLSEDGTSLEGVEPLFRVNFDKQRGYHFGGRILFLEDGTLLLTLGEGAQYFQEAQNLDNHLGTIVRLNDDGSVPLRQSLCQRQWRPAGNLELWPPQCAGHCPQPPDRRHLGA